MEAFNELQRLSGSPECAARYLDTVADLDVRELLYQVSARHSSCIFATTRGFRAICAANWRRE
jgi:hypothetical protein